MTCKKKEEKLVRKEKRKKNRQNLEEENLEKENMEKEEENLEAKSMSLVVVPVVLPGQAWPQTGGGAD